MVMKAVFLSMQLFYHPSIPFPLGLQAIFQNRYREPEETQRIKD